MTATMWPERRAKPRRSLANSAGELTRTALHEARHAVCCVALGVPVVRITIVPDRATRTLGHVKHGNTSAVQEAAILTAGLMCESKQYKRDSRDATRFANFTPKNQVAGRANAIEIDIANEDAIKSLADTLMRERTRALTGSRLQSVLRDLLVRPYLSSAQRRLISAAPAVKASAKPDRRFTPGTSANVRVAGNGKRIVGRVAVFFREGDPGTEFELWNDSAGRAVERIMPGAFDGVLGDDVRGLFNHAPSLVLGRTSAGTMKLSSNTIGLQYEIEAGKTTIAADVLEHLNRGDMSGSSFTFTLRTGGDRWHREGDTDVREILTVSELLDVGPVTFPILSGIHLSCLGIAGFRSAAAGVA